MSSIQNTYNAMFEKIKKINPSNISLQIFIPGINKTIVFEDIPCISSGEQKKMIGDINEIKTVTVVKVRRLDLGKSSYDTQSMIGIISAPTNDLKSLVEVVHINNCKYIIIQEKDSGFSFSDVVTLYLERSS